MSGPNSAGLETGELAGLVATYAKTATRNAAKWASRIRSVARSGCRIVLWGSGSKAVAFLSAVGVGQEIEYLVDINPHRHGKFAPGSGKQIVGPEFLAEYQPDLVIVMNPVYRNEISRELNRLNCNAALLCTVADSTEGAPAELSMPTETALST